MQNIFRYYAITTTVKYRNQVKKILNSIAKNHRSLNSNN